MRAIWTSGFAASVALRVAAMGLGMLANIVLARWLGPSELGAYAYAFAVVGLVSTPIHAGISVKLVREVARSVEARAWGRLIGCIRAANGMVLLTGIVIAGMAGLAYIGGVRPDDGALWIAALIALPLAGLSAVRDGALRGLQRPLLGQVPDALVRPVLFAAALLLASAPGRAGWAMALNAASIAVAVAVGTLLLFRTLPHEVRGARPEYEWRAWRTGLPPFVLLSVTQTASAAIPILVLGHLEMDAQTGLFRIAELGASLVILGLIAGDMVVAPRFVGLIARGETAELQREMRTFTAFSLGVALPVAIALMAFGAPLIALLFGEEFREAAAPLAILAIAQLVNAGTGPVGSLLNMAGHERETLRAVAVALVVNVVMCGFLVPSHGAVGGAIGAGTSLAMLNLTWAWRARVLLGVRSWPL